VTRRCGNDGQPLSEHDQAQVDAFARFLSTADRPWRALSLTRPWTELVTSGVKDVENRSWHTPARGWLVVHGAKSWDDAATSLLHELIADGMVTPEHHAALDTCDLSRTAPVGYLGIVRITDCHQAGDLLCRSDEDPSSCSPWAFDGSWHWRLEGARRFPAPIPGAGRLGLFVVPPEVQRAARQLALDSGVDRARH
jgi:hypothetical protein